MYAEVELPAEYRLVVETPDGVSSVGNCIPALVVETLGLLCTAEQQREGELSLISALWLIDEIDQMQFLV